jgi:hypothetical protein
MPTLIDAIQQTELFTPEIQVKTSIVLFKFGSKERANPTAKAKSQGKTEGNAYFKGTFVGEDERGNLTCQKVLNVYFSKKDEMSFFTGNGIDIAGVGSSCFVFLEGTLGWNDIELDSKLQANKSYTLSAASVCKYDSQGEFTYSELHADGKLESLTLKGTPGAVVTLVPAKSARVMEMAPKLDPATRPKRKAIQVSSKPVTLSPESAPADQDFEIPAQTETPEESQAKKGGKATAGVA